LVFRFFSFFLDFVGIYIPFAACIFLDFMFFLPKIKYTITHKC